MNSGDRNAMRDARETVHDELIQNPNLISEWYNIDYSKMSKEERLLEYKRQLVTAYNNMIMENWGYDGAADNRESIIKEEGKSARWVTYKPFQGEGIYDVIALSRADPYRYTYILK